jgi:hypothetical protein
VVGGSIWTKSVCQQRNRECLSHMLMEERREGQELRNNVATHKQFHGMVAIGCHECRNGRLTLQSRQVHRFVLRRHLACLALQQTETIRAVGASNATESVCRERKPDRRPQISNGSTEREISALTHCVGRLRAYGFNGRKVVSPRSKLRCSMRSALLIRPVCREHTGAFAESANMNVNLRSQ